jgi:hypothetical protein
MTWQGGKKAKEAIVPPVAFARLRPLMAGQKADVAGSLKSLSQALRNYGSAVRIHIHLGEGADGEKVTTGMSKVVQPKRPPATASPRTRMSTW